MSTQAFSDIVSNIANLTPDEIEHVQGLLSHKTQFKEKMEVRNDQLCYDAVTEELRSRGIGPHLKYQTFRRRAEAKIFANAAKAFDDFIDEHFGKVKRTKRIQIIRALTGIIVRDMEAKGRTIEFTSFSYQVPRLSFIIDEHFPSYLASGLISNVVAADSALRRLRTES